MGQVQIKTKSTVLLFKRHKIARVHWELQKTNAGDRQKKRKRIRIKKIETYKQNKKKSETKKNKNNQKQSKAKNQTSKKLHKKKWKHRKREYSTK